VLEGEEAAKKKAFQDGENFGKVNGAVIGFDVGYASGLSDTLITLCEQMPQSSKTKRIIANSNRLREAIDNLKSMHPENEDIQEELQSIKDKLAKLNSSISSSMRASPVLKPTEVSAKNIDW